MFRLPAPVMEQLRRLLDGQEFPGVRTILAELSSWCRDHDLACPSRATIYKFMQSDPGDRAYTVAGLPAQARGALYNLSGDGSVPGCQLAFYCFNYGSLGALHFAAGLPWWPLYQAWRMRGWRPRSRGLLRAALLARGITPR